MARKLSRSSEAKKKALRVSKAVSPRQAIKRLGKFFRRNGYIRELNSARRSEEGARRKALGGRRSEEGDLYKKGSEIRLVADTRVELAEIRRLLKRAGFKRARPFTKANQWRQPVYGVAEVARFLELIDWSRDEE